MEHDVSGLGQGQQADVVAVQRKDGDDRDYGLPDLVVEQALDPRLQTAPEGSMCVRVRACVVGVCGACAARVRRVCVRCVCVCW